MERLRTLIGGTDLAGGEIDPPLGPGGTVREMQAAHRTSGLDRLLEIEKRTTGIG